MGEVEGEGGCEGGGEGEGKGGGKGGGEGEGEGEGEVGLGKETLNEFLPKSAEGCAYDPVGGLALVPVFGMAGLNRCPNGPSRHS